MDRLTRILVGLAVGLGLLAARDARRAKKAQPTVPPSQPPVPSPKGPGRASGDDGMVIMRNEHIDDGIVVRSPFNGDPGMVGRMKDEG